MTPGLALGLWLAARAAWAGSPALAEGQAHLARGSLAQARAALERAVAADSGDAEAHLALARCYQALHRPDLAAEQAALALALSSPSAPTGMRAGATEVLVEALALTAGARLAEETLAGMLPPPERPAALEALARAYADAERLRDAEAVYAQILAADPDSARAPGWQLALVEVARRRGRLEDEVAGLEALSRAYGPDSAWARRHPEEASALQAEIDGELERTLARLGQDVQQMPPGAEAAAAARQLSALTVGWLARHPGDPRTPQVRHDHAMLLVRLGQLEEAAAGLEGCLRLAPRCQAGMAEVSLRLVQQAQAGGSSHRRWLRSLLHAADLHAAQASTHPEDARVQRLAAEGLLLDGQHAAALARLELVVGRWPASPEAPLAARRVLEIHASRQDWPAAREAATRFAATPALQQDEALRARTEEILQATAEHRR